MKFSHSIQFNAVPDWSSHYISYSNLKKLIYQLEKQLHSSAGAEARRQNSADLENSPLLPNGNVDNEDPDKIFVRKLDDELDKICEFYRLKELEIWGEVDALLKDVEEFEAEHEAGELDGEGGGRRRQSVWARARQQSIFRSFQMPKKRRGSQLSSREAPIPEEDDSGDDEDEHSALNKSQATLDRRQSMRERDYASGMERPDTRDDNRSSQELMRRRPSMAFNDFGDDALQALYDEGITLKKRIINLYVNVCELRSFIQLNQTGFGKVLKKYDKILDRKLKKYYLDQKVKPAYPFQESTMDNLNDHLQRVESAYAGIVTKGDIETARGELRLHLREHVVWERNTVWREMIGIERKAQAANLGIRNTMLGQDTDPKKARLQGDNEHATTKEFVTPLGRTRCPKFLLSGTFWVLVSTIAIFAVLLAVPIMEEPEQQNCLALVVFVSLLWATEVRSVHQYCTLSTRALTTAGHPALRHLSPRAIPGRPPPRRPLGRQALPPPLLQASHLLRLLRHVDSGDHAPARRLHHRSSAVQIQHCQDDGDVCPLESGHEAANGFAHEHGRGDVCEYVDL